MAAIHQFLAGFTKHDAISNEALIIQSIFRSWGFESDIFSETRSILPELRKTVHDTSEYLPICKDDDVVLLHLSMGTRTNEIFADLPCRKAILYHNVTPPHYFTMINRKTANNLQLGLQQVKSLAGVAQVNMADSQYNAQELAQCGYTDIGVLPLILDLNALANPASSHAPSKYQDGLTNIIFVGRCVPNKRIDHLVMAFYHFHKYVNPNSRLIHVGSFAGSDRYHGIVLSQVKELGIHNVQFEGTIPQPQLNAIYGAADLFLCMSEHEGFCIPILEAMAHDIPVMAYAQAAVPETMDGAGILFDHKNYQAISEMMGVMTTNQQLRASIIARQQERLTRYKQRDLSQELRTMLAPLIPQV